MYEERTIFHLKAEAHAIIDEIVRLGMKKNNVYDWLLISLGVRQGEEHIGQMSTMAQVKRAIDALSMLKGIQRKKRGLMSPKKWQNKIRSDKKDKAHKERMRLEQEAAAERKRLRLLKNKDQGPRMIIKRGGEFAPNVRELERMITELNKTQ